MLKPGGKMLWLLFALCSAGASEVNLIGANGQSSVPPPKHRTVVKGTTEPLTSTGTQAGKGDDLEWTLQDIHSDFWIHFLGDSPCTDDANGQTNYFQGGRTRPALCRVSTNQKGPYYFNIVLPDEVRNTRPRHGDKRKKSPLDQVKNCVGCYVTVQ